MGFLGFGKSREGGFMDVIRCDEPEYLVWKWTPDPGGAPTKKENAIRYGSSLRVKEGEVAVFVYSQNNGMVQDFIVGPYDKKIETANFPVLTRIVGAAFGGESPFQAEIYFINLSGVVQVNFAVPYFDVFDPRFLDYAVPMSVHGQITFNITDYKEFIKLNRLLTFNLEDFKLQIKGAVTKFVKGFVSNAPSDCGIPVLQIEKRTIDLSDMIQSHLAKAFQNDFGVNLKRFDLTAINVDKESEGYAELRHVTAEQQTKTIDAQTDINIKNLADMQQINAANMEETLRIQREEMQRAQKLQSETTFIGAHALNQQTEVMKTAAESMGQMNANMGGGSGGGFNPAGIMTGMMMGGAVGQQMAGMMNQMGASMNQMNTGLGQPGMTPPPIPVSQYYVAVNGQQSGPFTVAQLQQFAAAGQFGADSLVWKNGMAGWSAAKDVPELAQLLTPQTPPPPPPIPTL